MSRAGRSILHAANLPQFATDSPEQFVPVAGIGQRVADTAVIARTAEAGAGGRGCARAGRTARRAGRALRLNVRQAPPHTVPNRCREDFAAIPGDPPRASIPSAAPARAPDRL